MTCQKTYWIHMSIIIKVLFSNYIVNLFIKWCSDHLQCLKVVMNSPMMDLFGHFYKSTCWSSHVYHCSTNNCHPSTLGWQITDLPLVSKGWCTLVYILPRNVSIFMIWSSVLNHPPNIIISLPLIAVLFVIDLFRSYPGDNTILTSLIFWFYHFMCPICGTRSQRQVIGSPVYTKP